MSDQLPFDLNALAGGAVRAVFAPITEPVPTNIDDVQDLVAPYGLSGSWEGFGATTGPFTYARGLTTSGYTIQQASSAVLEVPNETTRTVAVPLAEIRPDILKMIEESPDTISAVAAAGRSAQVHVPTGSIADLTQYRVGFIGRRLKAQGIVQEGVAGKERGRLLAYFGYRAQIEAESVSMGFEKGALASATVTFKLFPEPTVTEEGEEYGIWMDEQAGVIALS